jgi:hypothetical protein
LINRTVEKKSRRSSAGFFIARLKLPAQAALAALPVMVMQHRAGMPAQHIIIGMPMLIMDIIWSQQAMNMLFMAGSMGIISQAMPDDVIVHSHFAMTHGMPIMPDIIGIMPVEQQHIDMPPHITIHGIPHSIMTDICLQQAMIMSFMDGSMAEISHFMPWLVFVHVIFAITHDIGPMPGIIPGIMLPIIGIIVGIPIVAFIGLSPRREIAVPL